MPSIAIIGGTGVAELDGFERIAEHPVNTPYGAPSRPIQEGLLDGTKIYFLQRHGSPAAIPPHSINYRANLWALQSFDIDAIVAINAVGGISASMKTGRLLLPDQVIDYTWGREHTFDEGQDGHLLHIDFTEPYDSALRDDLLGAAAAAGIGLEPRGVHGVTQGPRLESAAEVQRMARDGCDVVGMTGMPEAALARELNIPYAAVCMVVNAAAGLGDMPLTLTSMREILQREAQVVASLLQSFLRGRA
ncbi:S-methyl-5'-thioinosine phosphorylase [Candidatus Marimicrobium litorale]|uniref:Probable 6-oxopurine nucleoside phosphorylase n=1 Tax=Candidatus Marimicrobium litorale TaxID=2518991 RepID=A0ABT3T2E1_9GAMM|nr:S-methyl-5'-thioinosine phosphorylase [Candidatus Marimicrobium litorale]MCX2976335.1 S-methyl-5'-thioinosine phosphorylase [Candidatus Marimicrobium litorale]